MAAIQAGRPAPSIRAWALLLGLAGFAAGFFGPMLVAPHANQGPLLGLLITGPGGAVAGLLLGVLMHIARVDGVVQWRVLKGACAGLVIGTLAYALPDPAGRGEIVEADIVACHPPQALIADATRTWEEAVARVGRVRGPADWKARIPTMLREDPGVVLELRILRRAGIYEHRRPWNRGRRFVTPLEVPTGDEVKRYFARHRGEHCDDYPAGSATLYYPRADTADDPTWPPGRLPNFLNLTVLGPVPSELMPPPQRVSAKP